MLKIIECPRDAMQGWEAFIPTEKKIAFINQILKVGFDTVDFGSFVSPKAIPQMRDTADVLRGLDLSRTESKLLAIIANERGATNALKFEEISFLGYPFSVSETFQKRNTNRTISDSLEVVERIQNQTVKAGKSLVIYLSMGFGNPYGDAYHPDIVLQWAAKLAQLDISVMALSDTVGAATPKLISELFNAIYTEFDSIEFGAHFHTTSHTWQEKIEAAYEAGCRRFDGAILGAGGCPMAVDELTGNMPTEKLLTFAQEHGELGHIKMTAFESAMNEARSIFMPS
jgi:hydroxymethylglutaryl-CoA lyase